MDKTTEFLKFCYNYTKKIGMVKNQYDFSRQFLNKSQHYLSMLLTEHRSPSANSLYNLVNNLNHLQDLYSTYENKKTIVHSLDKIIECGNQLLTKKILNNYSSLNENPFNIDE